MGHRLAAPPVRRRLRRSALAGRVRRPGRVAHRAADLLRRDGPRPRALRRGQLRRHAARGPDAHRRGHRRAEGRAPPEDPPGRGSVVPGLLRARRGLRPRVAAHPRRARRRRLRAERAEDLVLVRPGRGHRRVPRAHRPRRAEAQGHLVADAADGHAGHRDPPAQDRARQLGVLRGVPHRRACAGGQPRRRGERRLARHQRHVEVRAGHRVRERAGRRDPPRATTSRPCVDDRCTPASSSDGASPSSTRCGRSRSATCRSRRAASPGRARW